jgi:hypothetical protein
MPMRPVFPFPVARSAEDFSFIPFTDPSREERPLKGTAAPAAA